MEKLINQRLKWILEINNIIKILEFLSLRQNISIFIKNFLKIRNLRVKISNTLSEN